MKNRGVCSIIVLLIIRSYPLLISQTILISTTILNLSKELNYHYNNIGEKGLWQTRNQFRRSGILTDKALSFLYV